MLIGIHGKAGAGKTTITEMLLGYLPDSGADAFAKPIKEMLEIMGVDCSDANKNVVHPSYGKTPREMMQSLGDWGRNVNGEDTWIKALDMRTQPINLIISDVRMENEADYVRQSRLNAGIIIHVVGRGGIPGEHSSEAGIEGKPGDVIIDNTPDPSLDTKEEELAALRIKVLEALVSILL